jgi:hypothetical protein
MILAPATKEYYNRSLPSRRAGLGVWRTRTDA